MRPLPHFPLAFEKKRRILAAGRARAENGRRPSSPLVVTACIQRERRECILSLLMEKAPPSLFPLVRRRCGRGGEKENERIKKEMGRMEKSYVKPKEKS